MSVYGIGAILSTVAGIVAPLADAYRAWEEAKAEKRREKKEARAALERARSRWFSWRKERRRVGEENRKRIEEKLRAASVDLDENPYE